MKQKIYILGLVVMVVLFTAVTFKLNHFPGASILLTTGIFCLLVVFLPLALRSSYRLEGSRKNLLLYIVTWITAFVVFGSMLFKLMHWPGAGILLTVALPFPFLVFLPVYLYSTSRIENYSIYNTVFVLFMLTIVSVLNGLLSLNVSRNTLTESLNLSSPYNRASKVLRAIDYSGSVEESGYRLVLQRSDELLTVISNSRELILKDAGSTPEEWYRAPAELQFPDSRQIVEKVMLDGDENSQAAKFESAVVDFITALGKEPSLRQAEELMRELFELDTSHEGSTSWSHRLFSGVWLSWTLVWLDEMEMNVTIIKNVIGFQAGSSMD